MYFFFLPYYIYIHMIMRHVNKIDRKDTEYK